MLVTCDHSRNFFQMYLKNRLKLCGSDLDHPGWWEKVLWWCSPMMLTFTITRMNLVSTSVHTNTQWAVDVRGNKYKLYWQITWRKRSVFLCVSAGPVPVEQENREEAETSSEDDKLQDLPPCWGLDIVCGKGTDFNYGPWADRQRWVAALKHSNSAHNDIIMHTISNIPLLSFYYSQMCNLSTELVLF